MARKKTPEMTRYEAETLLELSGSYSYRRYQKAYRISVKQNHPDMGGDAATMVKINQAKDTIEYYFGDDRSQVFTCATSQNESAQEQADAEDAYWKEQEQEEAARERKREQEEEARRRQENKAREERKKAAWQEAVEFAREHGIKFGFGGGLDPDTMTDKQRDYYSGMITGSWIEYKNMFLPNRMGVDLRGIPQSEWGEAEWASFKSFRVPDIEYGNNDTPGTFAYWYFKVSVEDRGFGLGYYPIVPNNRGDNIRVWEERNPDIWRLDDIGTTDWIDDDWFYFWYANYKVDPIIVKGVQYAHVNTSHTHHLHGPWAQREKAQANPNYKEEQRAYWHSNHSKKGNADGWAKAWIFTPLGDAQVEGDYLMENVGVPFAYATADLYTWHSFNSEYLEDAPSADDIHWSGLEFLSEEDAKAPWIIDLGLQDEVAEVVCRHEEKGYAKGTVDWAWMGRHPKISAWLFVLITYMAAETIASAWAYSTGDPEGVIGTAFAMEICATVAALVFRNKVIRFLRKIQRRVFKKA